jgi:hypothetical protein
MYETEKNKQRLEKELAESKEQLTVKDTKLAALRLELVAEQDAFKEMEQLHRITEFQWQAESGKNKELTDELEKWRDHAELVQATAAKMPVKREYLA